MYTFVENLVNLAPQVPPDSILSRTVHQDSTCKVTLFAFAKGQSLSEHSAGMPAILHFLEGEGSLTVGDEQRKVGKDAWAYLSPRTPHSIYADTTLTMLLIMLKGTEEGRE